MSENTYSFYYKNFLSEKYFTPQNRLLNSLLGLQWFAAEDEGRTEDPTEYKIRKAREEGRVAKSQDLNAALVVSGTGAYNNGAVYF